jgi:hypothetical protein
MASVEDSVAGSILTLASGFLLSLLLYVVDNIEKFQTNSDVHSINTRHKHDLHMLTSLLIRKVLTMQESNYSVLFQ